MISLIACINKANCIGRDNQLLYSCEDDMQIFKYHTKMSYNCLMGKNTFDSLSSPLKDRENIVVVRDKNDSSLKQYDNVQYIEEKDIFEFLIPKIRESKEHLTIIGGQYLYNLFLKNSDEVDSILLTVVDDDLRGDSYFPFIDEQKFALIERIEIGGSGRKVECCGKIYKTEHRVYKKRTI